MHFPDDFKKKLKEVLPEEHHVAVDEGNFSVVGGHLHNISESIISAETIVTAFKEGHAQEDVVGQARKILKAKELFKELNQLWIDQFGKKENLD